MMKKIIKDRILFFIIGGIIFSCITTYAAYKYQASEVGYIPSNSNFDVDNVSDAIKELYEKCGNNGTGGGNTSTDILGNIENSSNFLPTGYFKSTADDNNVVFGGYCWKIIRKNDDDDIRLLYNGIPQDGECNRTGEDTQIDTSKYSDDSTITNYNESKVKEVVDNWYNTNLSTSYSDKISSIDLITREEASTIGGGYLVSGEQYWTQTPSGTNVSETGSCSISKDRYIDGNYMSTEACSINTTGTIFSSGIYIVNDSGKIVNSNNGIYSGSVSGSCSYCSKWSINGNCWYDKCNINTGACYSTMTCCGNSIYEGSCMTSISGSSLGVRPVITLKNTVTMQGGNGKSTSPYYLN